jgi:hypothetical protein
LNHEKSGNPGFWDNFGLNANHGLALMVALPPDFF